MNIQNVKFFSQAIKITTITRLSLIFNSLGHNLENLNFLSKALIINKSITEINLEYNSIGRYSESMIYFAEALYANSMIIILKIGNNKLDLIQRIWNIGLKP